MQKGVSAMGKLTVLSMEQATTLPYLTYRLAADGMRVIRLENPATGDPNRWVGDNVLGEDGMYSYFFPNNFGKLAITLNLREEEGKRILGELISKLPVDIFACNQLPKTIEKLGITYNDLRKFKEDIIWVGITGFGPGVNEAAYDPVLQARTGVMDLTGDPNGPPMVTGVPIVDLLASEHGYSEIYKALYRRELEGVGSEIYISMYHSMVSWLVNPVLLTLDFGYKITRRGNTHQFFAPVSVYKTKDGYVYIAVGNDRQWKDMCSLPGFEFLDEERYAKNEGRIKDVENLNKKVEKATTKYTTEELISMFNSIKVPISKVNSIRDVVEDKLLEGRIIEAEDRKTGKRIHIPAPPVISEYLKSSGMKMAFPPRMGEHNEYVYGELLGYSKSKIMDLKSRGII